MKNKKSRKGGNEMCFMRFIELKDDRGELEALCFRKNITSEDLSIILSSTTLKPNFNDMEKVSELGVEPYVTDGNTESIGRYYEIDLNKLQNFKATFRRPEGKGLILYTKEDIKALEQSGVDAIELLFTSKDTLMVIKHGLYSPNPAYKEISQI